MIFLSRGNEPIYAITTKAKKDKTMDRKAFLKAVEAAPIVDTSSKFAPNPNIVKIFNDAKAKERNGYTVKVRLLPPDTKSSIVSIPETAHHTWGNGKTFRSVRCTGDKFNCPVCRENWKHHEAGDAYDKDVSMMRVDRYTNCYVISNPADPDSEGKVKILKIPASVWTLYVQATTGERKDEFGIDRVFSLDDNGVTLVIKVQTQNNRTSYEGSYFQSEFASKKDVAGLTEEKKDEIWNSAFDVRSELKDLFSEPKENEIIDYYVSQYSIPRSVTPLTDRVKAVYDAKVAKSGVSAASKEEEEAIGMDEDAPQPVVTKEEVAQATTAANKEIDDILA